MRCSLLWWIWAPCCSWKEHRAWRGLRRTCGKHLISIRSITRLHTDTGSVHWPPECCGSSPWWRAQRPHTPAWTHTCWWAACGSRTDWRGRCGAEPARSTTVFEDRSQTDNGQQLCGRTCLGSCSSAFRRNMSFAWLQVPSIRITLWAVVLKSVLRSSRFSAPAPGYSSSVWASLHTAASSGYLTQKHQQQHVKAIATQQTLHHALTPVTSLQRNASRWKPCTFPAGDTLPGAEPCAEPDSPAERRKLTHLTRQGRHTQLWDDCTRTSAGCCTM